jgi:acylphosphatase
VQGVFFRDACQRKAEAAGVTGWIRNDGEGTVTALFEGDSKAVDQLVQWCRSGPPDARVDGIETWERRESGLDRFDVR